MDETLKFTERDSGSNGFQVKYAAFEDEVPVISGGKQIDGWQLHDSEKISTKHQELILTFVSYMWMVIRLSGPRPVYRENTAPGLWVRTAWMHKG